MKKKPQDQRDWHEVRIETLREKNRDVAPRDRGKNRNGASDNDGLKPAILPNTGKRDGVGLANEPRAGLGTRTDGSAPKAKTTPAKSAKNTKGTKAKNAKGADANAKGKPRATKRGYEEPRPEPREQAPDSLAHEQERQTGMSGQSSGT